MDKKKFSVDFSGCVIVTAETHQEAEQKALDTILAELDKYFENFYLEFEGVEEE